MMHLLNAGVRRIHFPYWPLLQNVPNLYPPIMKSIFHDCVVGTSDPLPMPLK